MKLAVMSMITFSLMTIPLEFNVLSKKGGSSLFTCNGSTHIVASAHSEIYINSTLAKCNKCSKKALRIYSRYDRVFAACDQAECMNDAELDFYAYLADNYENYNA